jgi:hypothetical protein
MPGVPEVLAIDEDKSDLVYNLYQLLHGETYTLYKFRTSEFVIFPACITVLPNVQNDLSVTR